MKHWRAILIKTVGRPSDDRDFELATKAAILALDYGENWLSDAAVAVKHRPERPLRPWGYFKTCLEEATKELGDKLNTKLARVRVPPQLLRSAGPQPDLSTRLCVGKALDND